MPLKCRVVAAMLVGLVPGTIGCDAPLQVGAGLAGSPAGTAGMATAIADEGEPRLPPPRAEDAGGPPELLDASSPSAADACASYLLDGGASGARDVLDILLLVDNSSSMDPRVDSVVSQIGQTLFDVGEASGVDYRVILVSRYGQQGTTVGESDNPICIPEPLGAGDCSDPENTPLVHNPPHFYHYSADIASQAAWCTLLEGWAASDELPGDDRPWEPIAPDGWSAFVRPNTFKSVVILSDDRVECTFGEQTFDDSDPEPTAVAFDATLRALSPLHFGTAESPNYRLHSIVGLESSTPGVPLGATEPVELDACGDAVNVGPGYQLLSQRTGGSRFSICEHDNLRPAFEAVFLDARPGCP